jgi:hypothetical protein
MQGQKVYQESDQVSTVCTVTAIIKENNDEEASRQEEASHFTTPTLQAR